MPPKGTLALTQGSGPARSLSVVLNTRPAVWIATTAPLGPGVPWSFGKVTKAGAMLAAIVRGLRCIRVQRWLLTVNARTTVKCRTRLLA